MKSGSAPDVIVMPVPDVVRVVPPVQVPAPPILPAESHWNFTRTQLTNGAKQSGAFQIINNHI
jgi:hypothetical protein